MTTKKKTKKAEVLPTPPPVFNLTGTETGRSPMTADAPPPSFASKLTTRIEQKLREIDSLRDAITHHEKSLARAKEDLSIVLLNHQQATHDLEKALNVPMVAY